jgi:hypothetical protein
MFGNGAGSFPKTIGALEAMAQFGLGVSACIGSMRVDGRNARQKN